MFSQSAPQTDILLEKSMESTASSGLALEGSRWLLQGSFTEREADTKSHGDLHLIDLQTNAVYPDFHTLTERHFRTIIALAPNRFVLQTINTESLHHETIQILDIHHAAEAKATTTNPTKTLTTLPLGHYIRELIKLSADSIMTIHQQDMFDALEPSQTETDEKDYDLVDYTDTFDDDKAYQLKIWNVSDPAKPVCTQTFEREGEYHGCVARLYDNKLYFLPVASESEEDDQILVFDLQQSTKPTLAPITGCVSNFIIDPQSKTLIVAFLESTIGLYHLETLQPLQSGFQLPHKAIDRSEYYRKTGGQGLRLLNDGKHFIAWDPHAETTILRLCSLTENKLLESTTLRFAEPIPTRIVGVTPVEGNIIAVALQETSNYLNPRTFACTLDVTDFVTLKAQATLHTDLATGASRPGNSQGAFFHQPKGPSLEEKKEENAAAQKYMEVLGKLFP